jgi:DNA/RNA endonuclease G (NUC1)
MNRKWWWCVEDWERTQLMARDRSIGFAGPVLAHDDPVHGATETLVGRLRVRNNFLLPRRFWKVVAFRRDTGKLDIAAFYFDQEALLSNPPTQWKPADFRVSIDRIQEQTGLDFGELVSHQAAP